LESSEVRTLLNPLFRETSLERLSSPDRLDEVLHITRPRAWLGLIGLATAVLAIVIWAFSGDIPVQAYGSGILARSDTGLYGIQAPVGATVVSVPVHIGDTIAAGQLLASLSLADGTQRSIISPHSGRLLSISAETGSVVAAGQSIGVIDPTDGPLQAIIFVPAAQGATIQLGTDVRLQPATAREDVYGDLLGKVSSVSRFPATPNRISFLVQNDALVRSLEAGGPVFEVRVDVTPDTNSATGYKWSSGGRKQPPILITGGTLCTAVITLSHLRPRTLAFPASNH
jgi:multidrug efflux pump subunit AcrA (membrane-fusion protein)